MQIEAGEGRVRVRVLMCAHVCVCVCSDRAFLCQQRESVSFCKRTRAFGGDAKSQAFKKKISVFFRECQQSWAGAGGGVDGWSWARGTGVIGHTQHGCAWFCV